MKDRFMKNMGYLIVLLDMVIYFVLSYVRVDGLADNLFAVFVNGILLFISSIIATSSMTKQGLLLQANDLNYIVLNNELYFLQYKNSSTGVRVYSVVGDSGSNKVVKTITVAESTRGWTLSSVSLLDALYPVGTTFESYADFSPAETLGGVWVRSMKGRVSVGVDPGEESIFKPGLEGEKGGVTENFLTREQLPEDYARVKVVPTIIYTNDGSNKLYYGSYYEETETDAYTVSKTSTIGKMRNIVFSGAGEAIDNMMPYEVRYKWTRYPDNWTLATASQFANYQLPNGTTADFSKVDGVAVSDIIGA